MNLWHFFSTSSLRVMIFILVQVLIALSNAILMKKLEKFKKVKSNLKVSVLIPVRNEERIIKQCVISLLYQDYPNYEVIILNDNSTDKTEAILAEIKSDKLKVVQGEVLPAGWLGKSWACQQLSEYASGDLLFFTDADTAFRSDTLSYAVSAIEQTNADLITAIDKNEVKTFGEQITIPFIVWSIFTILPLAIAYLGKRPKALCAANGKFMLFRKEFYHKIGGHQVVKNNVIEDVTLAKVVKANRGKWRLYDASSLITSRMYNGFQEALQGFTKNYFALFGYKILIALFVWGWVGIITYMPLARVVIGIIRNGYGRDFYYSVASVIASCFLWLLMSIKFKFPIYQFLLYPITIAISIFIGLRSMILTLANQTTWKDRRLISPEIKWL